jgi:hypothetical protein
MKYLLLLPLFFGCTYNVSQIQQGTRNSNQSTGIENHRSFNSAPLPTPEPAPENVPVVIPPPSITNTIILQPFYPGLDNQ